MTAEMPVEARQPSDAVAAGSGGPGRIGLRRTRRIARGTAAAVVAVATALALLGLAIPLFLNPVWVSFEQDRSRSDALSGYQTDEVHRVTGALLHDLVIGPPAFDVADDSGHAVLDDRERSHLRDVRSVMSVALVAFVAAIAFIVVAGTLARRRPTFWRGVRAGARLLAAAVVVLGALSIVAFDAMFDLFHRLFFASGSYTFDPTTDRLVQLFPDQFWSETTIALGLVLLALAWDVNRLASRRVARLEARRDDDSPATEAHATRPAGALGR
jgi:integral membrane protein (TIGR01906 family)